MPSFRGIFPTQGSNPGLPTLQADSLPSEPLGKPKNLEGNLKMIINTKSYKKKKHKILPDNCVT